MSQQPYLTADVGSGVEFRRRDVISQLLTFATSRYCILSRHRLHLSLQLKLKQGYGPGRVSYTNLRIGCSRRPEMALLMPIRKTEHSLHTEYIPSHVRENEDGRGNKFSVGEGVASFHLTQSGQAKDGLKKVERTMDQHSCMCIYTHMYVCSVCMYTM